LKKNRTQTTQLKQTSQINQKSQIHHPPVDRLSPETFRIQLGHAARLRAIWFVLSALYTVVDTITPLVELTHRDELFPYEISRQVTGFTYIDDSGSAYASTVSVMGEMWVRVSVMGEMWVQKATGRLVGHRKLQPSLWS